LEKISIFLILLALAISSITLIIFDIYLIIFGFVKYIPGLNFEINSILTFIGSIIGGVLTLIGVIITINYYKRKDIKQSFPRKQFLFHIISSNMSEVINEVTANINNPSKIEEIIDSFVKDKLRYLENSYELDSGISMDCYNFSSVIYLIRKEIVKGYASPNFYSTQIKNLQKYRNQMEGKFASIRSKYEEVVNL
jgi:hypothetical protein